MKINISKLNELEEITIDEYFSYGELGTTNIKKAKDILFRGILYYDYGDEIILEGNIKGTLILEDAIDLSDYNYEINIDIDEEVIVKNYLIDIKEIVWENIVLEIPMKVTNKELRPEKGKDWEIKTSN